MTDPSLPSAPTGAVPPAATPAPTCPSCGTANPAGSVFCEACGAALPTAAGAPAAAARAATDDGDPLLASATPQTAPPGEESPLDVGWTGPVASAPGPAPVPAEDACHVCGQGRVVDGYCDHCGSPPPNPRDHYTEEPAAWVAGVCDIGLRHSRNEDALALSASGESGQSGRAVLVVCDGVTMATDSHIASLAAARAARTVLDQPLPRGVGTPETLAAAAGRALTNAVTTAKAAVVAATDGPVPNPPSCTFAAAVVEDGVVVGGTVGDSRVYWLPDAPGEPALQLGRDDSFAQEQMAIGVPRAVAETGPNAHAITRWLGRDAPEDLTPHLTTVEATAGWLLVCSDGLWNYCSEAEALRALLRSAQHRVGGTPQPIVLAQALVDFANEQGGRDNITVALARLAGRGSNATTGPAATARPDEGDPTHG